LLGNVRNFEILLGWEREYSRKTPVWEQVHLTFFLNSGLGKLNFLENSGLGTGTLNEFSKIPGELRAGKGFYSAHRKKSYSAPGKV
jgi:hypothetical protein